MSQCKPFTVLDIIPEEEEKPTNYVFIIGLSLIGLMIYKYRK